MSSILLTLNNVKKDKNGAVIHVRRELRIPKNKYSEAYKSALRIAAEQISKEKDALSSVR